MKYLFALGAIACSWMILPMVTVGFSIIGVTSESIGDSFWWGIKADLLVSLVCSLFWCGGKLMEKYQETEER